MLAARATRSGGEPRHRVGGDAQPAPGSVHTVDGLHGTIVAIAKGLSDSLDAVARMSFGR